MNIYTYSVATPYNRAETYDMFNLEEFESSICTNVTALTKVHITSSSNYPQYKLTANGIKKSRTIDIYNVISNIDDFKCSYCYPRKYPIIGFKYSDGSIFMHQCMNYEYTYKGHKCCHINTLLDVTLFFEFKEKNYPDCEYLGIFYKLENKYKDLYTSLTNNIITDVILDKYVQTFSIVPDENLIQQWNIQVPKMGEADLTAWINTLDAYNLQDYKEDMFLLLSKLSRIFDYKVSDSKGFKQLLLSLDLDKSLINEYYIYNSSRLLKKWGINDKTKKLQNIILNEIQSELTANTKSINRKLKELNFNFHIKDQKLEDLLLTTSNDETNNSNSGT